MEKPFGRPPKEAGAEEYQTKKAEAAGERNEIEATFGTGKRVCRANDIRAKLPETADCRTAMCYFAKNVKKSLQGLLHGLFFVLKLLADTGCSSRNLFAQPEFAYGGALKG